MAADSKVIAFAIVGVVIGAALGVGIGYMCWHNDNNDQTYYFYLDNGNSTTTGWYKATASNADKAIEKAFKGTDVTFSWSGGYPSFGEGYWYTCCYVWSEFSKKAADNSTNYPVMSYGSMAKSNGWLSFSGFDDTGEEDETKLHQSNSTVFYFSSYDHYSDPSTNAAWKTAEGTPFATE